MNDYKSFASFSWDSDEFKFHRSLSGWFLLRQTFIEILPEVRFLKKMLFVNAGFGMSNIKNKDIFDGYNRVRRFDDVFFTDEKSYPIYSEINGYFSFNFGYCIHYKKIGLVGGYGIRRSNFTKEKSGIPGIGYKQDVIKLGISYQLR